MSMNFPDQFADSLTPLPVDKLDVIGEQSAATLAERGYEVRAGLTREYAEQIMAMALEPGIREFCSNDCGRRFKDQASTAGWLSKKRGTFLLLKRGDNGQLRLAGYGWVGAESSSKVPGGETTFAIRIGEAGQGQGLAAPFARLIVAGSKVLYGARNLWLETWASNGGAVHVYHKIGFKTVAEEPDERLATDGVTTPDTRVYMNLPGDQLV